MGVCVCVCVHMLACERVCRHAHVKSCPTLCDPMDCSPPGSPVHGSFQARILERAAISSSRASSRPRDGARASCISYTGRQVHYHFATWKAP